MSKTKEEIKFEINLSDLAHEIVIIFCPELSEGSWTFRQKENRVLTLLQKNKDIFLNIN